MYFINKFNKCLILLISFLAISNLSYSADYLGFEKEKLSDLAESENNLSKSKLKFENNTDYPIQVNMVFGLGPDYINDHSSEIEIEPKSTYDLSHFNLDNMKEMRIRYVSSIFRNTKINVDSLRISRLQAQNFVKVIINPLIKWGWDTGFLTYTIEIDSKREKIADSPESEMLEKSEKLEKSSSEEKESSEQRNIFLSKILGRSANIQDVEPWEVFGLEDPNKIEDLNSADYIAKAINRSSELNAKFRNDIQFREKMTRKYNIKNVNNFILDVLGEYLTDLIDQVGQIEKKRK